MSSAAPSQSVLRSRRVVLGRCGAAAAVLGGLAWVLKAGVILVTGDEPAVAFAVGLVLFPFALLGLWWLVGQAGGKAGRVGGVVAAIAAGCGVLVVLVRAVGGAGVEPSEDDVTLLTPFITGAGGGTFVALLALGVAVRRTRTLAPVPAGLPLAMGIAAIPLLIVGGALESISERLIEVPIAVLGLAWIGLGIGLWNAATHGAAQTGAVADR